jgi:hypothetical protein
MVTPRTQNPPSLQKTADSCSREWLEEHALTSVTVLFGLGVAVGLLLGHTIAESTGRKMFHEDTLTEKLTGQIREIVKNTLPQGLSRHFS